MAEYWHVQHYVGDRAVAEIFIALDERYRSDWHIPYDRVEVALIAAVDAYWNAVPGPRKASGLMALCEPGPGELDHVVKKLAKTYTDNMLLDSA